MTDVTIEKRTGYDWTIIFRNPDDGEVIPCSIFGVVGMNNIVSQAFADSGMPEDWDIIAIIRLNHDDEVVKILT